MYYLRTNVAHRDGYECNVLLFRQSNPTQSLLVITMDLYTSNFILELVKALSQAVLADITWDARGMAKLAQLAGFTTPRHTDLRTSFSEPIPHRTEPGKREQKALELNF